MKNLPLNEKHLADKLQNVPVPDVNQSWEQMRKLLDREQPEPVAGAWSGNSKWWWMGITAAVVMIAAWLANPFRESEQQGAALKNDVVNVPEKAKSEGAPGYKKSTAPAEKAVVRNTPENQVIEKQIIEKQIIEKQIVEKQSFEKQSIKKQSFNKQPIEKQSSFDKQSNNKQSIDKPASIAKQTPAFTVKKTPDNTTAKFTTDNRSTIIKSTPDINPEPEIEASDINAALVSTEDLITPANKFTELQNNQPLHLAITGKTDKAFAREMRKKYMKDDNRRLSRASMRGNSGDNYHELTFAAGLALPQSFAISGQQSANYNIAARSNRITDYLPAPFFQYHLNDKVFLQTEFHFQSPQYTQRLLLSQSVQTIGNTRYESSQHLEKLYYFNIPFNVYYSPVRNFYVGGGLQYSSLLGGVATFEDKRSEGSNVISYTSVTTRFKDDSAAAVFRPSEWRYQFDASYNFNRLSLGMRYNQSMKDFINMQVGPNNIVGRNKAFLLYLRFNIWEERKKTND